MSSNLELPLIIEKRDRRTRKRSRHNAESRIISKRGRINVYLHKIPGKRTRYIKDLWTTLVNMRWRWIMLTVVLVNVVAYIIFTALFLFDAWFSGDFDIEKGDPSQLCIHGTNHFTSYFMLGVETITTTGYGYFYPTEHCRLGWLVLTGSTLTVIFIDGAFISVVYVKISRPAKKGSSSIFSKRAVISLRNGRLCLIFKVNDWSCKHWIDGKVHVFFIKDNISAEGELQPNYTIELNLLPHGVLFWPVDIIHEIDPSSPLWNISARELIVDKFEIVVVVTGSSVLTGNSSTSQTSYLSKEILWGYRFSSCFEYNIARGDYQVHRKLFNKTLIQDTPLCSAKRLNEIQTLFYKKRNSFNCLSISSDLSDHDNNNPNNKNENNNPNINLVGIKV